MKNQKNTSNKDVLDADLVTAHLEKIIGSDEFEGAARLREFLNYVVGQTLAGCSRQIRAKTILYDVYHREADGKTETEAVVRVDAGRLRRRLSFYYNGSGKGDAVEISIPIGGYVPVFDVDEDAGHIQQLSNDRKIISTHMLLRLFYVLTVVLIFAVGFLSWKIIATPLPISEKSNVLATQIRESKNLDYEAKRQAMFEKSPNSLQAYDVAQQARELLFPPTDVIRLQSALDLFKQAIILDESYFGGYAGAAQVLTFMEFFKPEEMAKEFLTEAKSMAVHAQNLSPTDAWVQSTLAWLAYVEGNYERSLKMTDRAIVMNGGDSGNRNINGLILVLNGELESAIELVLPHLEVSTQGNIDIDRNIFAVSKFHLGGFEDTIREIEAITKKGGSSGALTLCYLAAAYQATGAKVRAQELVSRTKDTWPKFKPEVFFPKFYRHKSQADQIISVLRQAGW